MTKLLIKVKTGSSQEKIVEQSSEIIAYLRAKPHDGEANKALIRLLATHFDVPRTSIRIVRGEKSHIKTIEF